MTPFQKFLKRAFDITASLLGIIVLIIPFLFVAAIIKFTSPGPLFFIQKRIGKHGRIFNTIKFRTMFLNSEKHGLITTAQDPRITPIGRILRRFKLDEFPQLINVLTGKMSFVGPRPDVEGYADKLEGDSRRILELRPGITGSASIFFRNEEDLLAKVENPKKYNDTVIWPKKVRINLQYLDTWSFWKDIGYILVTLFPGLNKLFKLMEETGVLNR